MCRAELQNASDHAQGTRCGHSNGPQKNGRFLRPYCPSWARTRTLLIQSQACCQLHQGAVFVANSDFYHGAEGDRTPDLLIANEALSQLSYSPMKVASVSAKDGKSTG
jgi:hypothetical protein